MNENEWNEIKKVLVKSGFFVGLSNLMIEGKVTPESAGKIRAILFSYLSARVKEAKREVEHLQAVLSRLDASCTTGMMSKGPVNQVFSGPVNSFSADLDALDGWAVSLYETDLTILGSINPTTRTKPLKMAHAMEALWWRREEDLLTGERDASMFRYAWGQ